MSWTALLCCGQGSGPCGMALGHQDPSTLIPPLLLPVWGVGTPPGGGPALGSGPATVRHAFWGKSGDICLQSLQDEFPEVERFSTCVLPSPESDDVVTSPFNACLSLVSPGLCAERLSLDVLLALLACLRMPA